MNLFIMKYGMIAEHHAYKHKLSDKDSMMLRNLHINYFSVLSQTAIVKDCEDNNAYFVFELCKN